MGSLTIWHWLIVLGVIALVFGNSRVLRDENDRKELARTPVYSAETTRGKEAEFIRDQLPSRFPSAIAAIGVAALCGAVWWFTR